MHGNIWEWCRDVWVYDHDNAEYEPGTGLRVHLNGDADHCVIRGGSFGNDIDHVHSAMRIGHALGARSDDVGFRPILRGP